MALRVRGPTASTRARRALTQIYSLRIFDRHCDAIYHQDWSHIRTTVPASGTPSFTSSIGATLQRVGGGAAAEADRHTDTPPLRTRGDALDGVSRSVTTNSADADTRLLPFDQEAKLIYGVVYSLRNMVHKLGGSCVRFQLS